MIIIGMVMSPAVAQASEARSDIQGEVIASFTTNEYDSMMKLKQTSDAELNKIGYSVEEVAIIKSFSFEEAMLERAQLSDKELYNFGYNSDQIALLKSYDGESLKDAPQMKAVFGSLTGNIVKTGTPSTNNSKATFNWEWTNAPLVCGVLPDIVACYYSGTAFDNSVSVVSVVDRSCIVDYYGNNNNKIGSKYPTVNVHSPHNKVDAKFKMVESFVGQQNAWAKKGSLTVGIKEESVVNQLYSTTYTFAYGHSIIQAYPSISLKGVGISFNTGVDSMYHHSRTIKYDGNTTFY